MKCPACGNLESKVVDSRPSDDGSSICQRLPPSAAGGNASNAVEGSLRMSA